MSPTSESLEMLKHIRQQAQASSATNAPVENVEIVVGMGTVGIAAGARQTLHAILSYIEKNKLENICVRQTGNLGIDSFEPVVLVLVPHQERVTYVKVTPEIADLIMEKHVQHGEVVRKYVNKE